MPARLRRVAAALLALGVLVSGPLPARAIDDTPPVPLPAEPPPITVPGPTFDALTADLDGDGANELVRLTAASDGSGSMAVEVLEAWGGGSSLRQLLVAPLRRDASVEEALSARPRPSPDNTLPLLVNDAARLLAVRVGERTRVVVAAIGAADEGARPCCLTLYEVTHIDGVVSLGRVAGVQQDAEAVLPVDLDGDGTEELVAFEAADDDGRLPLRVYRVFDRQPSSEAVRVDAVNADHATAIAVDADGQRGDEVVFTATHLATGQPPAIRLVRLARGPDGGLTVEARDAGEPGVPFATPWPDRALLVSRPLRGSVDLMAWPAGGLPRRVATAGFSGSVVGSVGRGDRASLLLRADDDPDRLVPLDRDLAPGRPITGRVASTPLRPSTQVPYVGPWPGGAIGGVVFLGQLIGPEGASDPVATLLGARPLGPIGPGSAATVILTGSGLPRPTDPSLVSSPPAVRLDVVSTNAILQPEAEDVRLGIGLRGAVLDVPGGDLILAPGPRFDVLVDAPLGARVGLQLPSSAVIDLPPSSPSGRSTVMTLPVELAPGDDRLTVVVVTPAGATYLGTWSVEQRTGPPSLAIDVPLAPLSARVTLSGRTEPDTAVLVDGAPAVVDAAGRFSAIVNASLAPTSVTVEATDPLGHRAAEILSVVGWVDYRRLPWIPLVATAVLAVGIALWLRVPRPRSWTRRDDEDDALLEEIDA
jgi:hypothetical protein